MRYFISVPISGEPAKKLAGFKKEFVFPEAKIIFVQEKNLHVTLAFLGGVSKECALEAFNGVKKKGFKPFKAEIFGVHAFPSDSNPRVLFAGFSKGSGEFRKLIKGVEGLPKIKSILDAQNLLLKNKKQAEKEIVPHITLGRVKWFSGRKLPQTILNATDFYFSNMFISGVCLMQSSLSSTGPVYVVVERAVF